MEIWVAKLVNSLNTQLKYGKGIYLKVYVILA